MSNNGNTRNIDSVIVENQPLVSHMIHHKGGACDCVSFLRTSSQKALEGILTHTHQRKNIHTPLADEIIHTAKTQQKQEYIDQIRGDEDISLTRHRLPHTKNRIIARQPVRKGVNYIRKSLGDTDVPPTITDSQKERTYVSVMEKMPIQPQKISDTSLKNLGFLPSDFDTYCTKAKEIYKESIWKKVAHILSEGKPVFRSKIHGRSSRIMQIKSHQGETRYTLFVNQDALHTHTTPSRTSQHKIESASFRVFETYDELLRSQEYALNHLKNKYAEYTEWHIALQDCYSSDKEDSMTLLQEAGKYFGKQKGFYPEKIFHYLNREIKKRGFLGHAIRNLYFALQDIEKKIQEISQVYQNLAKGREKIIMQDVQDMAKIINQ